MRSKKWVTNSVKQIHVGRIELFRGMSLKHKPEEARMQAEGEAGVIEDLTGIPQPRRLPHQLHCPLLGSQHPPVLL